MSRNSNRSMQLFRHTSNSWLRATGRIAFVMIIIATCVVNSRGQTQRFRNQQRSQETAGGLRAREWSLLGEG